MKSKLEQSILEDAKQVIDELTEKMKHEKFESDVVIVPFISDNVIDKLYWSVKDQKFTHIEYSRVKKNATGEVYTGEFSKSAGYADAEDIEYIKFEI